MKETLITLLSNIYKFSKETHIFKFLKVVDEKIIIVDTAKDFDKLTNPLLDEISSLLNTGYTLTEETTTENTVYLLFEKDSDTVELMITSEPE